MSMARLSCHLWQSLVILSLLFAVSASSSKKTTSSTVCPPLLLKARGPHPYKVSPGSTALFIAEIGQKQLKRANSVVYKLTLPDNLSFVHAYVLGASTSSKLKPIIIGSNLYWTGLAVKKGQAARLRIKVGKGATCDIMAQHRSSRPYVPYVSLMYVPLSAFFDYVGQSSRLCTCLHET